MPKHVRRKKTISPARAKARAVAAAVAPGRPPAPPAKAKPAKKRGRRRGLLSGLATHEHERDILDQYLHEVSKTPLLDRKSTRLNSSHGYISYAVFCLKKKKKKIQKSINQPTGMRCRTSRYRSKQPH